MTVADGAQEWELTETQRADTVARVANNISSMAFFSGRPLDDDTARAAAITVEKKAYTVARVEARTTTGVRCVGQGLRVG